MKSQTTTATTKRYNYIEDKPVLSTRMKKIEGQARGIRKMIEEERYCVDIVQQLTALSSAIDEVSLRILESHIEGCVVRAMRHESSQWQIKELMATIRKAIKH
jgi:DNA-binding FrmR family transcriptional regulator